MGDRKGERAERLPLHSEHRLCRAQDINQKGILGFAENSCMPGLKLFFERVNLITMDNYKNAFIEFLYENQALLFGSFTLKSGRQSPYFFNMGLFNNGASLMRLGEFYASALQ